MDVTPPIVQKSLLAKLFNGFADPSRLAIVNSLRLGAHNVTAIVERTGLSQPNVSSHLRCLRECNLVKSKRNGRTVLYSLTSDRINSLVEDAENLLLEIENYIATCDNYKVS